MILMIFSHLKMSRMLLSSSCILVFLLCLSHECNGRHLSSNIDDHALDAQLLSTSTIKDFEKDTFIVHDDLNLKVSKEGKNVANTIDGHDHNPKDYKPMKNKKEMIKTEKVKKVKEEAVHHPKSVATVTFRVPPKNKRIQQQPGFNLDYSPPKTHPPSHN